MAKKHIEALDVKYKFTDCKANSIREYMHALLHTLFDEGEGFSGKRPFGNSCWEYDIIQVLVKHKFVKGSLDEDGSVNDYDRVETWKFIFKMIDEVFKKPAQIDTWTHGKK